MKKQKKLDVASKLFREHQLEIMSINLMTEEIEELKVSNTVAFCEEELYFSKYIDFMIMGGHVHEDDQEVYIKKLNIDNLRKHFKTNTTLYFRYRHLVENEYRFVDLTLLKSNKYSFNNPIIYMYLSDINDIQVQEFHLVNKLKEVTAQAEEANRSKSDFLSKISHDIRNPLNVITGMTTLCKNYIDDEVKMKEYLNKINESTEFLLNLINDTLDVSKIESKKIYLKYTHFHIEDLILSIVENMNMIYKQHKINIDISVNHPIILADKARLQQIINNLLCNSCKYTLEVNKEINVSLNECIIDSNTSNYIIEIEDHGIGMNDDILKRIFKPYERGIDSRINKIQGTGLGMAIAKNLIDLMNGTIKVESEVGVGTKFTVEIPFKHSMECIINQEKPLNEQILNGKHVLVAEDYEINQIILEEFLKIAGVECEFAKDGLEVIEKYVPGKYNAILMDIQMPNMDGYEATKNIRNLDKKIPIIAISADAFKEDVDKMVICGMNDHVSKPIEQNKLLSVLTKYMN